MGGLEPKTDMHFINSIFKNVFDIFFSLVDAEAEAIAAARRKRDADFQVDAYAKSAEVK